MKPAGGAAEPIRSATAPPTGIVTISHEMGAGGSTLGAALAARLGYRCVDDQALIPPAALRHGVAETRLAHFAEAKPSLLERFGGEARHCITILQSAMLDVAESGSAVIVGRSGQVLLRDVPHVLRLLLMAPFDLRVRRVTARLGTRDVEPRAVADLVRRSDREKVGRMRYLFDVDWRDPALYDLVISTEKVSVAAVADAVVNLVRRPEFAPTDGSRQMVRDRALAARVRAALAADSGTRDHRISIEASHGSVVLEGTMALDEAARVARSVAGVEIVEIRFLEPPVIPPFVA